MTQDLSAKLGKPASPFAFGVMQFGGKADAGASAEMYAMCRVAGITIFDAAWLYTGGQAEALLGQLAERERDQVILTTKCAYAAEATGRAARPQVLESLDRLRTDCVDILYLHRDPGEMLDETLETMAALYAEGRFRLLGVSNFAAWRVMHAQSRAAALGAPRIEVLQPMYNLVKRQAEVELLPMAQAEGLTVHSYSPLGGGLLTGKYAAENADGRLRQDPNYATRYGPAWMQETAQGLGTLAAELGIGAEALAIAWAATHPGISAPILSASHPDQLPASLAAAEVEMTPALHARLTALTLDPPPATDRLDDP